MPILVILFSALHPIFASIRCEASRRQWGDTQRNFGIMAHSHQVRGPRQPLSHCTIVIDEAAQPSSPQHSSYRLDALKRCRLEIVAAAPRRAVVPVPVVPEGERGEVRSKMFGQPHALVREWTGIRAFILVPPVTASER
jgi:hypothetical protein